MRTANKIILFFLLGLTPLAFANQRAQGDCMKGNGVVVTSGLNSTTKVMQSFPLCTITVFLNQTSTPATLFSDNVGTPLSNPFTSDSSGHWFFYVANGRYDVQLSGGGIGSPFTLGDILVNDPTNSAVTFPITVPQGGTSATNVISAKQNLTVPIVNITDYNFPAISPGGSLTGGITNTITFPNGPPPGVSATDTTHPLFISGGVGTVEAPNITGGTCTLNQVTSCTLTLLPLNTHTGAWTIQSATAGIEEALVGCAGPCTVTIPPGSFNIQGLINIPAATSSQLNYRIVGSGRRTTLLNVASTFSLSSAGVFVPAFNAALTYAPPGPILDNFGVVFVQNYAVPLASFTQWPPVLYANTVSGGQVKNLYVSGAWQALVFADTTGGFKQGQWVLDDLQLGGFGPGVISIDGASDTFRLHDVHWWPFYNQNPPGGDSHAMYNPAVIGLTIGAAASVEVSDSYFLTGTNVKFTGSIGASAVTFTNTGFDAFGIIDMTRAAGGITATFTNCFFFQEASTGTFSAFTPPMASIAYGATAPNLTISNSIFYRGNAAQPLISVSSSNASSAAFGQFNFLNNMVYDTVNSVADGVIMSLGGGPGGQVQAIFSGNTIAYTNNLAFNNPMLSVTGAAIGLTFQNNTNAGYGSGTWLSVATDLARNNISGNIISGPAGAWTVTLPTSKVLGVYQDQTFQYPLATPTILTTVGTTTAGNFGRFAVFFCNATGGQVNHNLPTSNSVTIGNDYELVKTDASANSCFFVPAGTDTINGLNAANGTNTQYGRVRLRSNGAGAWFIE